MRTGRFTRALGCVAAAALLPVLLGSAAAAFDERKTPLPNAFPDSTQPAAAPSEIVVPPAPRAAAEAGAAGSPARPKKPIAYNDLWRFGRDQRVHEDEVVRGQVVVVGGNLRVDGEITGGAVVIAGNIEVGPRGRIEGQAVAVAGRVTSAPGAAVRGALSLSAFSTPLFRRWGARAQQAGEIVADLLKVVLLLVLSRLLLRLLGPQLESARREFASGGWRCIGLGLFALPAAVFTAIVVSFLLALSLVGMPIALLLLVAVAVVSVVSLLVGAFWFGSWLGSRSKPAALPTWRHLALGLVCLRIPELVADALRWVAPESSLAFGFEVADVVLELTVLAGGLGALVLVRWGAGARPSEPSWLSGA